MHLAGGGRLQALPQPVLQGVEPDEHAIGWEQAVWTPPIVRPLLVALRRVDENQASRRIGRVMVGNDERSNRRGEVRSWQATRGGVWRSA